MVRRMGNEISSEGHVRGQRTNARMSIEQIWYHIEAYHKQILSISGALEAWKWISILRDRAAELEEECVLEKHYPEMLDMVSMNREQIREFFKNKTVITTSEQDLQAKGEVLPKTQEEILPMTEEQILSDKGTVLPEAIKEVTQTYETKSIEQDVQIDCSEGPVKVTLPIASKIPEVKKVLPIKILFEKKERPTWDEYFLTVVEAIAQRSTCDRGRSGCVVTKGNHILAAGYVGSPRGFAHCDEVGHLIKTVLHEGGEKSEHCVRTVHAEQNAICQAVRIGTSLEGGTLYSTMIPCRTCAMLIIQCGIVRVVSMNQYQRGNESLDMLLQAGIEVVCVNDEVLEY